MNGFQFQIKGNWAHFKRPETNNNPLTYDLITKTALIGLIGSVLGIERKEMRLLFPQLSEDLLYGVQLMAPIKKYSWGFSSKKAINPTAESNPKYFEFIKDPFYLVTIVCTKEKSDRLFKQFKEYIKKEKAIYPPVLGWHNCPANLFYYNEGVALKKRGPFTTKGFFTTKDHKIKAFSSEFRVGFDKVPTFQNDDFWNLPEKYVEIAYPDYEQIIEVEGDYFEYFISEAQKEQWCLI